MKKPSECIYEISRELSKQGWVFVDSDLEELRVRIQAIIDYLDEEALSASSSTK